MDVGLGRTRPGQTAVYFFSPGQVVSPDIASGVLTDADRATFNRRSMQQTLAGLKEAAEGIADFGVDAITPNFVPYASVTELLNSPAGAALIAKNLLGNLLLFAPLPGSCFSLSPGRLAAPCLLVPPPVPPSRFYRGRESWAGAA